MADQPRGVDSRLLRAAESTVNAMVRQMVEDFVTDIPVYGLLPSEQLRGEIRELCRTSLRSFFRTTREGRPLGDAELAEPRASAARRAEEQVPLDALLAAYHTGGQILWETLRRLARPDEQDELVSYATGVLTYLQSITGAVAAAYVEERQTIAGEARDAQRALAQALLGGSDLDGAGARAGIAVGGAYAVVAFTVGREPEPAGVAGRVTTRRRQRRIQEVFDGFAGEPAAGLVGPDEGIVVIRARERSATDVVAQVPALAARIQDAAGRPVTAVATDAAEAAEVPAAGRLARELLELAGDLGRPAGGYRLADLLLDYQLTRPTPARAELAALLDPLRRNPDFLTTLNRWLDHGQDRRATAAVLHIHPNTLDYRLRRIRELTTIDPVSGRGAQLLAAALAARRIETHA